MNVNFEQKWLLYSDMLSSVFFYCILTLHSAIYQTHKKWLPRGEQIYVNNNCFSFSYQQNKLLFIILFQTYDLTLINLS